jgi:hypothetical protein
VAKELAERGTTSPESIIKQIVDNPQNVFSLSMTRLKRPPTQWREVIKPVRGVMLAAREPLGGRHNRQILGVDDDRLREGIERLGGLIVRDWQQRYSLFHPKFYEYLLQDEGRPTKDYIENSSSRGFERTRSSASSIRRTGTIIRFDPTLMVASEHPRRGSRSFPSSY